MTDTAVAVYFYETLNVHRGLAAKLTFNRIVVLDFVTKLSDIVVGKVLCAGVRIDAGSRKDLLRTRKADAVNIGQRYLDSLLIRNLNT